MRYNKDYSCVCLNSQKFNHICEGGALIRRVQVRGQFTGVTGLFHHAGPGGSNSSQTWLQAHSPIEPSCQRKMVQFLMLSIKEKINPYTTFAGEQLRDTNHTIAVKVQLSPHQPVSLDVSASDMFCP